VIKYKTFVSNLSLAVFPFPHTLPERPADSAPHVDGRLPQINQVTRALEHMVHPISRVTQEKSLRAAAATWRRRFIPGKQI
jgi:hypothetical protein